MRTVTFQSVLDGAAARIGLDPTQTIQPSTASALTEYINTRTRFAWEAYKWPELSAVEKRTFRPPWKEARAYTPGIEVYYDGSYYRSLTTHTSSSSNEPTDANNGANNWALADTDPSSGASAWNPMTSYSSGAEVIHNGKLYRRKNVTAAASQNPGTNPTIWAPITLKNDFIRSIDFEQTHTITSDTTLATEIGEVMYVYAQPALEKMAQQQPTQPTQPTQ